MTKTPYGLVFRPPGDTDAPIWRIANIDALIQEMERRGVRFIKWFAHDFFDLNRFPAGALRNLAMRMNSMYYRLNLPARFAHGIVLIGEKN